MVLAGDIFIEGGAGYGFIFNGLTVDHLRTAHSGRGAWRVAASPALQSLLNNRRLLGWGFITPDTLAREALG